VTRAPPRAALLSCCPRPRRAQGATAASLVGGALDTLAELRSAELRLDDENMYSLGASTEHFDVTAEHAWAESCACVTTGLEDAAALLERFRGVLLANVGGARGAGRLLGAPAVDLLGSPARPLHVHLVAGAGPCAYATAPSTVLVAHSLEEAEVLLCALLLAGGKSACCATAAPALATALRDSLVQDGHVGTARPIMNDAPGLAPASAATFTAATFAARGGDEAAVASRRAMWSEFLDHTVARRGLSAVVAFARAPVAVPRGAACTPADAAAALEAAAAAAFAVPSFSKMLEAWAHATWQEVANTTPNAWAGGIGSKTGADPTALGAAKEAKQEEASVSDGNLVQPMSVVDCWKWMLTWLWAEKRKDMYWCMASILWNCLWTLYSPVILRCAALRCAALRCAALRCAAAG
jgi:hypothetical protein